MAVRQTWRRSARSLCAGVLLLLTYVAPPGAALGAIVAVVAIAAVVTLAVVRRRWRS
ncbi:MAG TPA: hypothetical protein VIN56_09730 [Candidatus Dormibacteraeota bacterium]